MHSVDCHGFLHIQQSSYLLKIQIRTTKIVFELTVSYLDINSSRYIPADNIPIQVKVREKLQTKEIGHGDCQGKNSKTRHCQSELIQIIYFGQYFKNSSTDEIILYSPLLLSQ